MTTTTIKFEDYESERETQNQGSVILAIRRMQSELGADCDEIEITETQNNVEISMTATEYLDQFEGHEIAMILQKVKREKMINQIKATDFDNISLTTLSNVIKLINENDQKLTLG